ncbi:MAG: hypothetical protein AB7E79_08450 [Rhodospirillaceae bacterium]
MQKVGRLLAAGGAALVLVTAASATAHEGMLLSLRNLAPRPDEGIAWFQIEMDEPAAITYRCQAISFWTINTAQTDFEGHKVVLEGWTDSPAARLGANQTGRLNNLLVLMRFEDEPEPMRLTGRIQYWRRDDKGIMRIREEELKPDQIVLEPRPVCPAQP